MEAATATPAARRTTTQTAPDQRNEYESRENPWVPPRSLEPLDPWRLHRTPGERDHLLKALTALTPREREVACAVCMGGDNEAVADRLCIAVPTLRTYLMRINQKLGTTSKGDILRFVSTRLLEGYRHRQIENPAHEPRTSSAPGKSSVSMTTA